MKRSLTLVILLALLCGCTQQDPTSLEDKSIPESLVPENLTQKDMDINPYMAFGEAHIHNDSYNSDVTDAVLPLGIYPEVNVSMEKQNLNAPPAIFYDNYGNAFAPLLGGIAIRDMDAETVTTLGAFIPSQHDTESYSIQSSYTFIDSENHVVCPTSHNHVMILKATDADGNILPVFEKLLDIDINAAAETTLGRKIDQNLLSIVFDYEGNLWFTTGGFRIYPDRQQTGIFGYLSRNAIDTILAGGTVDLSQELHFYETEPGEGSENGIASSKDGAVIMTNQACYLLKANNGVEVVWRTPYESNGANDSQEGAATTGGGLAWGSGSSPSLTRDLVLFTDNLDPVNLLALDMKTGELVASIPVIDELPENMPVSVENSIIVYDNGTDSTGVIVCNWFGAGSPNLAKADSDSSIQTYSNIYDSNWVSEGNVMIMPGMERVDVIKTEEGYEMKSAWYRDDIRDTSMFKLSTATGYLYGYVQDKDSGMWQYIVLDYDTGETVLTMDVSSKSGYNNMAIGMFCGSDGNALYCPTNCLELVRMQDRFVYLPEMPYREVDLDLTERHVVSSEQFAKDSKEDGTPATYLHTVTVENVHTETTVAIRVNGLTGKSEELTLYAYTLDGTLTAVPDELWSLENVDETLEPSNIYEIHFNLEDDGPFDLNDTEKNIKLSALLATK